MLKVIKKLYIFVHSLYIEEFDWLNECKTGKDWLKSDRYAPFSCTSVNLYAHSLMSVDTFCCAFIRSFFFCLFLFLCDFNVFFFIKNFSFNNRKGITNLIAWQKKCVVNSLHWGQFPVGIMFILVFCCTWLHSQS